MLVIALTFRGSTLTFRVARLAVAVIENEKVYKRLHLLRVSILLTVRKLPRVNSATRSKLSKR